MNWLWWTAVILWVGITEVVYFLLIKKSGEHEVRKKWWDMKIGAMMGSTIITTVVSLLLYYLSQLTHTDWAMVGFVALLIAGIVSYFLTNKYLALWWVTSRRPRTKKVKPRRRRR